jgi:acetate kinase
MREVERAYADGDQDAGLALGVFVHRLTGAIAAMAASAGGLDALIFTAGIGEESALVRERTCRGLEFVGVKLDPSANAATEPDCDIASKDSAVRLLVIGAHEDLIAARAARTLLDD